MARRVRVLTDSVADIPQAFVDRLRIKIVPVTLVLNGLTYRDDGSIDRDWFYNLLSQVSARPMTAAPAPHEFHKAFAEMAADGAEEIVAVVTSSAVSSIYDHAMVAAANFDTVPVHVVDSSQVSMGTGWSVIEAAERLAAGAALREVLDQIEGMTARAKVLGLIDSVDYLRRSGRVGWITGTVAEALRIKPLICFSRGKAQLLGRVRTYRRGMQALLSRTQVAQSLARLSLLHSRATPSVLEETWHALTTMFPDLEIPIVDIGTVFATHVGPGCLGVAFIERESGGLTTSRRTN